MPFFYSVSIKADIMSFMVGLGFQFNEYLFLKQSHSCFAQNKLFSIAVQYSYLKSKLTAKETHQRLCHNLCMTQSFVIYRPCKYPGKKPKEM